MSNQRDWMQNPGAPGSENAVSANEITSLNAMIMYIAHRSGETEFSVARRLANKFGVANATCLPAAQFDNALRYLVDGK